MAPSAERSSGFKDLNENLNRRLNDLQSQIAISRDKLKKAKLSAQAEKDEAKRLRLAVDRQRIAKEGAMTEMKELQTKLDAKDKEVGYFVPSLHPLVFMSDYLTSRLSF